jgi:hypothetical protein
MSRGQLDVLDGLVAAVERAAEKAPVAAAGASVWFWYGPDHRDLRVPPPDQLPNSTHL